MYLITKLWKPEVFQGKYKNKNYFEGWYFKLLSQDKSNVLALIPGIPYTSNPNYNNAFIQITLRTLKGRDIFNGSGTAWRYRQYISIFSKKISLGGFYEQAKLFSQ